MHLQDYILMLQSRLLDLCGEYPPPPTSIHSMNSRASGSMQQHSGSSHSVVQSEAQRLQQAAVAAQRSEAMTEDINRRRMDDRPISEDQARFRPINQASSDS